MHEIKNIYSIINYLLSNINWYWQGINYKPLKRKEKKQFEAFNLKEILVGMIVL